VQPSKYMKALAAQSKKDDCPGTRLLIVTGQPDVSLAEPVQGAAEKYGVETSWLP
jgi:hypothetical protein